MKKEFTPIAMRCTQEQFEAIKPKLEEIGEISTLYGAFKKYQYLTNNFGPKENCFDFIGSYWQNEHQGNIHEKWNEKVFLEACGIETEQELEEELWLPVHNYHGFYEVSNMGNVRSLSRQVRHSKNPLKFRSVYGRMLSKSLNPQGYNKVRLSMYGKDKTHLVYHLVSEAFLNHIERSDFVCVDHIDEDKTNDKAKNLQIISKQENTKKSFDYKLDSFNVGEFWFHNTGELVLINEITKLHGGTIKCKHINNTNDFAFHSIKTMDRKATESEVFEALKNEAVKRGFVEGVYVECFDGYNGIIDSYDVGNVTYGVDYPTGFNFGGKTILHEGVWATIKASITRKEAENKLGVKIVD